MQLINSDQLGYHSSFTHLGIVSAVPFIQLVPISIPTSGPSFWAPDPQQWSMRGNAVCLHAAHSCPGATLSYIRTFLSLPLITPPTPTSTLMHTLPRCLLGCWLDWSSTFLNQLFRLKPPGLDFLFWWKSKPKKPDLFKDRKWCKIRVCLNLNLSHYYVY